MDYKELAKEAQVIAESFRQDGNVYLPNRLEMYSSAITDLLARVEAAEARAEKAERERDAAVSDLETIMAYGEEDLDTCGFCKNGQCYARGGTKPCFPKWRGQKEE